MAAAFDRAGFAAVDVHMSDIIAGRVSLKDFKGLAACGGFSYGDVLGAGEGWAKSILFNARARDEFESFLPARRHLCAGRVQRLPDDEQSARHHPRRGKLAAFRAQQVGAVRGALRHGGSAAKARRCSSTAWRAAACRSWWRTAKAMPSSRTPDSSCAMRKWRCATSTIAASRRNLSAQPQWLARRHHRPDHAGWPLHHHDAAPGTGVPRRAAFLASRWLARGRAVAADVPQCAEMGGISPSKGFR